MLAHAVLAVTDATERHYDLAPDDRILLTANEIQQLLTSLMSSVHALGCGLRRSQ